MFQLTGDRCGELDGYDKGDEQVWGAEIGAYVFDKMDHRAPE